jgi:hypothetical protein
MFLEAAILAAVVSTSLLESSPSIRLIEPAEEVISRKLLRASERCRLRARQAPAPSGFRARAWMAPPRPRQQPVRMPLRLFDIGDLIQAAPIGAIDLP